MKNILLCVATTIALALPASGANLVTKSGYGNSTTPAEVNFQSDPSMQCRIVYANYGSDSNTAVLSISTGTTALNFLATNSATTTVTNVVQSTAGIPASPEEFADD